MVLDIVFVAIAVLTALWGLKRGKGRQIISIISWAVTFGALYLFGHALMKPIFSQNGGIVRDALNQLEKVNIDAHYLVMFLIIFVFKLATVIVAALFKMISGIFRNGRRLTVSSRLIGLILGLVKSAALILTVYTLYQAFANVGEINKFLVGEHPSSKILEFIINNIDGKFFGKILENLMKALLA